MAVLPVWPRCGYTGADAYAPDMRNRVSQALVSNPMLNLTYLHLSYNYTGSGNVSRITDSTAGAPSEYNYHYSAANQLTSADVMTSSGAKWNVTYAYDGAGNRLSETWRGNMGAIISTAAYQYSEGNYLAGRSENGAPTAYSWGAYGQQVSKSGAVVTQYVYDGRRIASNSPRFDKAGAVVHLTSWLLRRRTSLPSRAAHPQQESRPPSRSLSRVRRPAAGPTVACRLPFRVRYHDLLHARWAYLVRDLV